MRKRWTPRRVMDQAEAATASRCSLLVSFFVRSEGRFFVPTRIGCGTPRAAAVEAGRRGAHPHVEPSLLVAHGSSTLLQVLARLARHEVRQQALELALAWQRRPRQRHASEAAERGDQRVDIARLELEEWTESALGGVQRPCQRQALERSERRGDARAGDHGEGLRLQHHEALARHGREVQVEVAEREGLHPRGDLVTQRLLKSAMAGGPPPYPFEALDAIAAHLTKQEDAANKVERQVAKSAAALLLDGQTGERFDAVVTGASAKGTWVRLCRRPVEGRLVSGVEGLDVGDRLRVRLVSTDVERGFIDFAR